MSFFKGILGASALSVGLLSSVSTGAAQDAEAPTHIIEVPAKNREERSRIANLGYSIDEFRSDKVFIYGHEGDARILNGAGLQAKAYAFQPEWFRWTSKDGKVPQDGAQFEYQYHSYDEVSAKLAALAAQYPAIASAMSLGHSLENRNVPLIRISGKSIGDAESQKLPAIMYMGCHHAREHLSVEVPLLYAEHLLSNYGKDADITRLVDSREIFIAPLVNPDGHVYDYRGQGAGRMWRKNRSTNSDGTRGVDLNRNYGFRWGTGGSSRQGSSDTFMGPAAFSEPETVNIRDFVRSQKRISTLLTLHTFSELVLYPWGFTYDDMGQNNSGGKVEDHDTFKKMADTMAGWNGYTPQQSSDLYITSGDTTDWAYGELGIFAFTFELTPTSIFSGGFYPEPTVIQPTFNANLKPLLYMLEYADNPHRVKTEKVPDFLAKKKSPARMGIPTASFDDIRL